VPAILDTSAAFALTVIDDQDHDRVTEAVVRERSPITIPSSVVAETSLLTASRVRAGAEAVFVRGLANSHWRREELGGADLLRIAELIEQYADARLDFVDASVIAVAERLGASRILTLDRRDFSIVRPRHVEAFEIMP
jgi:predicted nucleic acid-binding protein